MLDIHQLIALRLLLTQTLAHDALSDIIYQLVSSLEEEMHAHNHLAAVIASLNAPSGAAFFYALSVQTDGMLVQQVEELVFNQQL